MPIQLPLCNRYLKLIFWLQAFVFYGVIVASHYVRRQTIGLLQVSFQALFLNARRSSLKVKRFPLLLLCMMAFFTRVLSQDSLHAIAGNLIGTSQNLVGEQLFVHTDKDVYAAGEILWFKIYNMEAGSHTPLTLSKIAYIELLDTANKPVLQAKIALTNASGKGSFYLPVAMPSASYTLRAYTNWMKNFDASGFFHKNIAVINVQKLPVAEKRDTASSYFIRFFPEGGNLVNNIKSRIAFKGNDMHGQSMTFTGAVVDGKDTLTKLKSSPGGTGSFYFTPAADHVYKVFVQPAHGKAFMAALPAALTNGYAMEVAVSTADSSVSIVVETGNNAAKEVYLVVHKRQQVITAKKGMLQNGKAVFTCSETSLPDGVSAFTIFTVDKQPVCERLYFKRPHHQLQLSIDIDKATFQPRNKVSLSIQQGNMNAGDTANLSMAVYSIDSLQQVDDNTIETYLLLTADAGEGIQNPSQYFNGGGKETEVALDNLMLINGWHQFKRSSIPNTGQPLLSFVPEYNGHIVTGNVVNTQTGKAAANIQTYLSAPGTRTQFSTSISDSNGNIHFEMDNFFGGSKIIAQTNTQRDSTYRININNPFSQNFSTRYAGAFMQPEQHPNTLLQHSISMQVQNIYTSALLNRFDFPAIDTSAFYLHADATYLLDNYTRFTTMEEVLREYIALVNVAKREGRYHFPVLDLSSKTIMEGDPLVLMDGMPEFDFNRFIAFDPLKVKKMEVVNRKYFLGNDAYDGILNCQTYNGDLASYEIDPRSVVLDYEGLQLARTFYAPVYDNDEKANSHLPDFRNVLYWNPDITLKGSAPENFSFYTSDLPGKYAVVLQGLTNNGLCGSKVITFTVEKASKQF